jgi:hypothetical protein
METSPLSTIYNMVHVAEGLGTAGQPTTAQLAAIKDAGYEVIINLATGTTPRDLPNEAAVVATLGMEYIHNPGSLGASNGGGFEPLLRGDGRHAGQKTVRPLYRQYARVGLCHALPCAAARGPARRGPDDNGPHLGTQSCLAPVHPGGFGSRTARAAPGGTT